MSKNRRRRSYAHARAGIAARRRPFSFWTMAALAVLALIIQSLVVQSHIHIPQRQGRGQTVSLIALAAAAVAEKPHAAGDVCTESTPRDRYPVNEDPSNCPLCQEMAHSGQFVHSVAALAAVPLAASVHLIVFDEVLPSVSAVSHIWLCRAPPAHQPQI